MLLVITPTEFASAIQPLQVHKEQTGILTTVITLDEVYRDFPGRDEAERVKHCIAHFHQEQDIRFVMLVGDSDTFPVRYTKTDRGDVAACNTAFYPTDLYFAVLYKQDGSFDDWDWNHNGYYGELQGETHTGLINVDRVSLTPTVAVGRMPASSLEEVKRFVQKIIRYETRAYQASWVKNALLLATHNWIADACRAQERIAKNSLNDYNNTLLSSTGSSCASAGKLTSAAITTAINQGVGVVSYIGHGSPSNLEIPNDAWGINHIAQLSNRDWLPVMCCAACSTAEFASLPPYGAYTDINGIDHVGTEQGEVFSTPPPQPACLQRVNDPDQDLATLLTVRTDAGVIAYVGGNTGMQMYEPLEYFLQGLVNSATLGEAWQWMIQHFYKAHGLPGKLSSPDWFAVARVHQPWKFMLFGDPSLRITGATSGMWSPQQLTSGDRGTSHAPALAVYHDKLYMAWKGKGSDVRIFYSVFDGNTWSPQQLTSGDRGTSHAPALAVYGDKLYMVWKGKGSDARIFYSVFDGSTWSPQQLTAGDRGTSHAPALAVYGDKLYMVWKGKGSDARIFYSAFDGNTWSPQQLTAGDRGTSHGPALAVYRDKLYMTWKGMESDVRIFYSVFDGNTWSPQQLTAGDRGTSDAPTLATHQDKLLMGWKGLGSDPHLFYSYLCRSRIEAKYIALGGALSFLGNPLIDELVTPDGIGHYRHYQAGSIYWTPDTGAWEVHGAIRDKWAGLGWESSLGYPTTDETPTPDGVGRFNHFRRLDGGKASIYWTPATGAWEVHGAIRELWASLGWERSWLGYPLSDEAPTPDGVGRCSHFQGGTIYWMPERGAWVG